VKTPHTLLKALVAVTGMATLITTAHADQTISGAVGLPLNPTAQIPEPGSVRVQGTFMDLGRPSIGGSTKLYGLYGAGRVGDNLEVSGGLQRFDVSGGGANERNGISLGAKYLFNRSNVSPTGVRFAVGAGYNRALYKNAHVYAVGTGYLRQPTSNRAGITGHLGVRYDRYENDRASAESNKASVFGGVEVPVTNDGRFAFVENTNSQFGSPRFPYSASVRYRATGGLSASVGVARQGIVNDNGVFLQVGKTF
jgi:hypothetical protein